MNCVNQSKSCVIYMFQDKERTAKVLIVREIKNKHKNGMLVASM
jgi:hypothetical protein